MDQATLDEIAESCKVTKKTAYNWAVKAGKKISSIKRRLEEAGHGKHAIFSKDEVVCILTEGNAGLGMLAEEKLGKKLPQNNNELEKKLPQARPTFDQKLKISELIVRMMELSERTTPGMPFDYHLNIAKKRLSGLAANNKYTPAMNLLEAPNNEEESKC